MVAEPRGFGFVTYDDISSVDAVMAEEDHIVDGKLVECKRAVPKESMTKEGQAAATNGPSENKSPISGQSSG